MTRSHCPRTIHWSEASSRSDFYRLDQNGLSRRGCQERVANRFLTPFALRNIPDHLRPRFPFHLPQSREAAKKVDEELPRLFMRRIEQTPSSLSPLPSVRSWLVSKRGERLETQHLSSATTANRSEITRFSRASTPALIATLESSVTVPPR